MSGIFASQAWADLPETPTRSSASSQPWNHAPEHRAAPELRSGFVPLTGGAGCGSLSSATMPRRASSPVSPFCLPSAKPFSYRSEFLIFFFSSHKSLFLLPTRRRRPLLVTSAAIHSAPPATVARVERPRGAAAATLTPWPRPHRLHSAASARPGQPRPAQPHPRPPAAQRRGQYWLAGHVPSCAMAQPMGLRAPKDTSALSRVSSCAPAPIRKSTASGAAPAAGPGAGALGTMTSTVRGVRPTSSTGALYLRSLGEAGCTATSSRDRRRLELSAERRSVPPPES